MHLFISKRLGYGIRVGAITGPLLSPHRCSHPIAFVVGILVGLYLLHFLGR